VILYASRLPARMRFAALVPFKRALAGRYGPERGFEIFRDTLGLPPGFRLEVRRLRGFHAFAREHALERLEPFPGGDEVRVDAPVVEGPSNARSVRAIARAFVVACLEGCTVAPHSAVTIAGEAALIDAGRDELRRYPSALECDASIFAVTGDDVYVIADDRPLLRVAEAYGSFLGPQSADPHRWFWALLPKYFAALEAGMPPSVPVVVPEGVNPMLLDALNALSAGRCEIVKTPSFARLGVDRLWVATDFSYSPLLEIRGDRYGGPDRHAVPAERFAAFRAAVEAHARTRPVQPHSGCLFVEPEQYGRPGNASALQSLLRARGTRVADLRRLEFCDVFEAVRAARRIVVPAGARTYAALFARGGTQVCVIADPFVMDTALRMSVLPAYGVEAAFFTGPSSKLFHAPGFPDFGGGLGHYTVDLHRFGEFLDRWENEQAEPGAAYNAWAP